MTAHEKIAELLAAKIDSLFEQPQWSIDEFNDLFASTLLLLFREDSSNRVRRMIWSSHV